MTPAAKLFGYRVLDLQAHRFTILQVDGPCLQSMDCNCVIGQGAFLRRGPAEGQLGCSTSKRTCRRCKRDMSIVGVNSALIEDTNFPPAAVSLTGAPQAPSSTVQVYDSHPERCAVLPQLPRLVKQNLHPVQRLLRHLDVLVRDGHDFLQQGDEVHHPHVVLQPQQLAEVCLELGTHGAESQTLCSECNTLLAGWWAEWSV